MPPPIGTICRFEGLECGPERVGLRDRTIPLCDGLIPLIKRTAQQRNAAKNLERNYGDLQAEVPTLFKGSSAFNARTDIHLTTASRVPRLGQGSLRPHPRSVRADLRGRYDSRFATVA